MLIEGAKWQCLPIYMSMTGTDFLHVTCAFVRIMCTFMCTCAQLCASWYKMGALVCVMCSYCFLPFHAWYSAILLYLKTGNECPDNTNHKISTRTSWKITLQEGKYSPHSDTRHPVRAAPEDPKILNIQNGLLSTYMHMRIHTVPAYFTTAYCVRNLGCMWMWL